MQLPDFIIKSKENLSNFLQQDQIFEPKVQHVTTTTTPHLNLQDEENWKIVKNRMQGIQKLVAEESQK